MRAYRLEADREEEIRRSQASGLAFGLFVELRVAEGLDRLDPAFSEIPRHALDQHPAQPATGERGDHPGGRQQDGVGRDRRGRKRHGPRHVRRRREHHEPSGHAVDVDELAAGAPLQERLGDPGLLLQLRLAAGARPLGRYRIELPVDAPAAWSRKVLERIERQIDKAPRHRPLLDERNSPAKHPPPSNQDDRTRKTCGTGGIRHFPPRPAGRPITPPTRGWAAPAGSHLARRAGSRVVGVAAPRPERAVREPRERGPVSAAVSDPAGTRLTGLLATVGLRVATVGLRAADRLDRAGRLRAASRLARGRAIGPARARRRQRWDRSGPSLQLGAPRRAAQARSALAQWRWLPRCSARHPRGRLARKDLLRWHEVACRRALRPARPRQQRAARPSWTVLTRVPDPGSPPQSGSGSRVPSSRSWAAQPTVVHRTRRARRRRAPGFRATATPGSSAGSRPRATGTCRAAAAARTGGPGTTDAGAPSRHPTG